MVAFRIFLIVFFIHTSHQLNNGLGRTPQMGWTSWYAYQCQPSETLIQLTADIIVVTGLAAVGYEYVSVDDCWQDRRIDDNIQPDSQRFPSGMRALGDYIHSKNLKFGLSSDAGMKTCDNRPGSLHYETRDANTYASWGVDYLYYENCFDDGTKPEARFPPMRDALNATGRPIFLAIREWGSDNPFLWEVNVANSWRTTQGAPVTWKSILYNIDINNQYSAPAGPGGWNDPGVLQFENGVLSNSEQISQFSLWTISKAPLLIGGDLGQISEASLETLKNPEVIAVNQDLLGVQGKKVAFQLSQIPNAISDVIIENCSLPTSEIELKRFQWTYNDQDGSIRSAANNLCLSIEDCSSEQRANVIVNECRINDPQAQCQGKNQQWTYNTGNQTFVSRMNGQCLDVAYQTGPNVDSYPCSQVDNQVWIWNSTVRTFQSKYTGNYLTFRPQLEIWAVPISNGSQAVLLFNRGSNGTEPITVKWSDIGFSDDHSALVRDLWARQDLGTFTGKYTSPNIDYHSVMMLKITPTK